MITTLPPQRKFKQGDSVTLRSSISNSLGNYTYTSGYVVKGYTNNTLISTVYIESLPPSYNIGTQDVLEERLSQ